MSVKLVRMNAFMMKIFSIYLIKSGQTAINKEIAMQLSMAGYLVRNQ